MFDDNSATTNRTIRNIKKTLAKSLELKYGITDETIVNKILSIHGLDKKRFDVVNSVETIINDKLNDVSIDANSNKNEKTIEGIQQEAVAPLKKAIGYDYLYRQMVELYDKDEAKRLSGEMYDFSLGLSDSTNILKPYCWSLDASKIVTIGRDFGQLHSTPAKRLSSYISALCETVHQLSSHMAGAIAIGTFFLDVTHLLLIKGGYELSDIEHFRENKKIENEFQQFIHSVNHLSRNGVESPFTNISIFDRPKLHALINEMKWYFDGGIESYDTEYIVDYIIYIQNIFLDLFDKGDPLKGGAPYRFPVVTVNFSKQNGEIIDKEFLSSICQRDIFRYNIFVSEGTKIASCCRLINDTEMMEFASQSNSFGAGGSISLGSHRVCTLNLMRIGLESYSQNTFFKLLEKRIEDTAKILKAHKELIRSLTERGLQPFIKNGWINMNRMFSTFGIMGLYEVANKSQYFSETKDIHGHILKFINEKVFEYSKKYNIIGNIEQIPGESFAIRLAQADKVLYEESQPFEMYSNQHIPLWVDATIWERMEADGKYNQLITGGGIAHINIGEKTTPTQSQKIIEYAVKSGCEHFALNSIYSECENSHTSFGKKTVCPVCLGKIIEMYTRIVGFHVPVSSWQDVRREWEFPKRNFGTMEELGV